MHRKSYSTPSNSRPERSISVNAPIRRANSYESLPQLQASVLPSYAIPMNALQACYMGTVIPQFAMLHSTTKDTPQPTTAVTVSASGWEPRSDASPAWSHTPTNFAQPFQKTADAPTDTVAQVATNSKSRPTPASSVDCSDVNDKLSTSKKHPSDSADARSTFKYDQYITGDGGLGWDENKDYAAAPARSSIDSKVEVTQKPLQAAKSASKDSTQPTKKKPRKKTSAHRRSVSATNRRELTRRSLRKKKISDAIQTMKEIMLDAGVEGCPVDQHGIILSAVRYMKTLRAQLASATNQYAQLAERFTTMRNGPTPVMKPLADTGPDVRMMPLASMPPLMTMPTMTARSLPSPPPSVSTSTENGTHCRVHQECHDTCAEPSRRKQRRKQSPAKELVTKPADTSFAEEVRKRIRSRNESVGATDFAKLTMGCQRPNQSEPQRLDTKTAEDADACLPLESLLDFDFLPSSIAVDADLLQSIDALSSPPKSSFFATPPSSPFFATPPSSPQLLLPLTSLCTSPPPDL